MIGQVGLAAAIFPELEHLLSNGNAVPLAAATLLTYILITSCRRALRSVESSSSYADLSVVRTIFASLRCCVSSYVASRRQTRRRPAIALSALATSLRSPSLSPYQRTR